MKDLLLGPMTGSPSALIADIDGFDAFAADMGMNGARLASADGRHECLGHR